MTSELHSDALHAAIKRRTYPFECKLTPSFPGASYRPATDAISDHVHTLLDIFFSDCCKLFTEEDKEDEQRVFAFISALSPLDLYSLTQALPDLSTRLDAFIRDNLIDDNPAYYQIVKPAYDQKWLNIQRMVKGLYALHCKLTVTMTELGLTLDDTKRSLQTHLGLSSTDATFSLISIRFQNSELRHLNGGVAQLKQEWSSLCYEGLIREENEEDRVFISQLSAYIKAGFIVEQESEKLMSHLSKTLGRIPDTELTDQVSSRLNNESTARNSRSDLVNNPLKFATETMIQGDLEVGITFIHETFKGIGDGETGMLSSLTQFALILLQDDTASSEALFHTVSRIIKRRTARDSQDQALLKMMCLEIDYYVRCIIKKANYPIPDAFSFETTLSVYDKLNPLLDQKHKKNLEFILMYRTILMHYADAFIEEPEVHCADLYEVVKEGIQEDLVENSIYLSLDDLQIDIAQDYIKLSRLTRDATRLIAYLDSYSLRESCTPYSNLQAERSLVHVYDQLQKDSPDAAALTEQIKFLLEAQSDIGTIGLLSSLYAETAPHMDQFILLQLHNEAVGRLKEASHSKELLTVCRATLCLVFLDLESSTDDIDSLAYVHHLLYEVRSARSSRSGITQLFKRNPKQRLDRLKKVLLGVIAPRFNLTLTEKYTLPLESFRSTLQHELKQLFELGSVTGLIQGWLDNDDTEDSLPHFDLTPPQHTGVYVPSETQPTLFSTPFTAEEQVYTYETKEKTDNKVTHNIHLIKHVEGNTDSQLRQHLVAAGYDISDKPIQMGMYFSHYCLSLRFTNAVLTAMEWELEEALQLDELQVDTLQHKHLFNVPLSLALAVTHISPTLDAFIETHPDTFTAIQELMKDTRYTYHFKLVETLTYPDASLQNFEDAFLNLSFSISLLKPYILKRLNSNEKPDSLSDIQESLHAFQKEYVLARLVDPQNRTISAIRVYKSRLKVSKDALTNKFNHTQHGSNIIEEFVGEVAL